MLYFDSPPSPYARISNSESSNNNRYISNHFHSIKKPILIIFLFLILLIIAIKIYLSIKINDKHEGYDHSPVTHRISLATETVDNELSCPISMNNASWNQQGAIIVNRFGRCGSDSYELCHPNDLFIDNIHQNLYVVDIDNNRIQKYSLNEQINDKKGVNGMTVAFEGLKYPTSVFVDGKSEDMYILDCDLTNSTNQSKTINTRVQLWRKNSNVGQILINKAGICHPTDYSHIILDKQMNIYVEANDELRKWFSSTNYTYYINIIGISDMFVRHLKFSPTPRGLYIDDNLTIYTIDQNNKNIEKWFLKSILSITIKSDLNTPSDLILDCNQLIYYGDLYENIIYQLNPITNITRIVLDLTVQRLLGQFGSPPLKMKFDKFYNMFVIDREHSRIIKYSIL